MKRKSFWKLDKETVDHRDEITYDLLDELIEIKQDEYGNKY